MKIIVPSVEIMRSGLEKDLTPEQHIERVGRTCYKSEDKITNDSAAKFVSGLIKRGHEAMIEHYSLIFKVEPIWYEEILADWDMLLHNGSTPRENCLRPYLRFTDCEHEGEMRCIVSGNMRAWRDFVKACRTGFGFIPQYLYGLVRNYPNFFPEFQDYVHDIFVNDIMIPIHVYELVNDFERRTHWDVTVKIVCNRGVSHEAVRHRVGSFAQESTRYCNYGLDKFGNEITVVRPSWCEEGDKLYDIWRDGCLKDEATYLNLLENGATPQMARGNLDISLKTELVVTMNLDGWYHFYDLRCAPDAHPDIREVAEMTQEMMDLELAKVVDILDNIARGTLPNG